MKEMCQDVGVCESITYLQQEKYFTSFQHGGTIINIVVQRNPHLNYKNTFFERKNTLSHVCKYCSKFTTIYLLMHEDFMI